MYLQDEDGDGKGTQDTRFNDLMKSIVINKISNKLYYDIMNLNKFYCLKTDTN